MVALLLLALAVQDPLVQEPDPGRAETVVDSVLAEGGLEALDQLWEAVKREERGDA